VAGCKFPRSQLRGSAGFSPASLSLPSGKDAHTERILKERKKLVSGIYWEDRLEVKQTRIESDSWTLRLGGIENGIRFAD
jgi:hypothetical protein